MTRHVNYSSFQRVDLSDVKAAAEFSRQDIRRVMRQLLIGADSKKYVLLGFDVTPENPGVSSSVIVKMDLGSKIGSFIGAENYGGGNVDFGQIAGGKDAQGNLDGNAQSIVNFAGQPAGSYDLKVRFTFVEGVSDNRAFWNPATDVEFIKSTQTRLLPQWEAAITGHADPEWVLLATVAWDGVAVETDDIVDKRDFAFEGASRDDPIEAYKWTHPDQESAADYGVQDFSRDLDRGDPDVNIAGVIPMLRALARQIQDIKGPREGTMRFDWFSRPHAPAGFLAAGKPDEWRKNLHSIDTVTFTVGDGTTAGDFTGSSALMDCFEFIQDNGAILPNRIRIVLKSKAHVSGLPILLWDKNIVIDGKNIELIGRGNGYNFWPVNSEIDGQNDGQSIINVSIDTDTIGLHMTGNSSLYLENIAMGPGGLASTTFISLDQSCGFRAKNAYLAHYPAGTPLQCGSERCIIDNCIFSGMFFIGGKAIPSDPIIDYDATHRGGIIRNTIFWSARLRLRHDDDLTPIIDHLKMADRLRFQNCEFVTPSSAIFPGQLYGTIDGRSAQNISFDQCHFQYAGDEDCLRLGSIEGALFWPSRNISIRDSQFILRDRAYHLGYVSSIGGVNGSEGTGWAIKIHPGYEPVLSYGDIPRGITIDNCEFRCNIIPTPVLSSPDAGAIMVYNARNVTIKNSRITEWTAPFAGNVNDSIALIDIRSSLGGFVLGGGQNINVDKNFIGDWRYLGDGAKWEDGYLSCIYASGVNGLRVTRNYISAVDILQTSLCDPSNVGAALLLGTGNNVDIEDNDFLLWRSTDNPLNNSCFVLLSVINGLRVNRNNFYGCGGYNIYAQASAEVYRSQFNSNAFMYGDDENLFRGPIYLNCTTEYNQFHDNYDDYNSGAAKIFHTGTGIVFTLMGNHFRKCNAVNSTLAGAGSVDALGYASAAAASDAPNRFLGYT